MCAFARALKHRGVAFGVYVVLLAATGLMLTAVPGGFIPTQDKLYLIGGVKVPEGSSLDRTGAVISRMSQLALETEGVDYSIAFPGQALRLGGSRIQAKRTRLKSGWTAWCSHTACLRWMLPYLVVGQNSCIAGLTITSKMR
jgi:multidrug efflux pump subunit AcrB